MANIMGIIQKAKDKFNEAKINRLQSQTEALKKEKLRAGQLAQAQSKFQKEQRDVQNIKSYNAKVEQSKPSVARALGSALAKMTNSGKQEIKQVAKSNKGNKKVLMKPQQQQQSPFFGGMGLQYGPQDTGDRFGFGQGRPQDDRFSMGVVKRKGKGPFDL